MLLIHHDLLVVPSLGTWKVTKHSSGAISYYPHVFRDVMSSTTFSRYVAPDISLLAASCYLVYFMWTFDLPGSAILLFRTAAEQTPTLVG